MASSTSLVKDIAGDARVAAAITAIGNVPQQRGFWLALGEEGKAQTEERFDTSTGPDGNRWPKSWREKLGVGGGPTLVNSGDMRRSMTVNASDQDAALVVPKDYAAPNQFGAKIKPVSAKALAFRMGMDGNAPRYVFAKEVNIPARPFLGFSPENVSDLVRVGEAWIAWSARQQAGGSGAVP